MSNQKLNYDHKTYEIPQVNDIAESNLFISIVDLRAFLKPDFGSY